MKSAFAKPESHTYTYPEPIDPKNERSGELTVYSRDHIDQEVIRDISDGEEAPWATIRIPRSKGDKDAIADATQAVALGTSSGTVLQARLAQGNRAVFELLCEAWSFDAMPSAENFGKLDVWAAAWLTACIVDAQRRAEPDFQAVPENGTTSSTKPAGGRSGRAKANVSA